MWQWKTRDYIQRRDTPTVVETSSIGCDLDLETNHEEAYPGEQDEHVFFGDRSSHDCPFSQRKVRAALPN